MTSKTRKLTNPLALAVLVLLFERPMHPYEMAATMRERRKEASIKLHYGSLYTVIQLLLREGFIKARETLREGRRPEKTVYGLTPAGRAEMHRWLAELVGTPIKEFPWFEAGLSLLPALPPEEALALLEKRVELLKDVIKGIEAGFAFVREMKLPRLFTIESEYHLAQVEAERAFIQKLLPYLCNGADDGIARWRALHRERKAEKPRKKH